MTAIRTRPTPEQRYNPPSIDMSAEAIAWRRRVYIEADQRAPFASVATPANRHIPPPPFLPPRVEYRGRFNSNDFERG